jgi:hypothetical protein
MDRGDEMTIPSIKVKENKTERKGRLIISLVVLALAAAPVGAVPSSAAIPNAIEDPGAVSATAGWDDAAVLDGVDFTEYPGSLYAITRSLNADAAWKAGYTGLASRLQSLIRE